VSETKPSGDIMNTEEKNQNELSDLELPAEQSEVTKAGAETVRPTGGVNVHDISISKQCD
jgi:hypothetical protein